MDTSQKFHDVCSCYKCHKKIYCDKTDQNCFVLDNAFHILPPDPETMYEWQIRGSYDITYSKITCDNCGWKQLMMHGLYERIIESHDSDIRDIEEWTDFLVKIKVRMKFYHDSYMPSESQAIMELKKIIADTSKVVSSLKEEYAHKIKLSEYYNDCWESFSNYNDQYMLRNN